LDEINKPIKSNKPGGKTETMSLAKYEQGIYIYDNGNESTQIKNIKVFFQVFFKYYYK